MSNYIPQHLRPEEFVAVHKNQVTLLHSEVGEVHAARVCLAEVGRKEDAGLGALLGLVCDKVLALRDGLTPERMTTPLQERFVEVRERTVNHVQ